ncbi:MAG: oligoendopeptidase F, partial [Armatimonadetes bacterium]|nr:oligoendopeptidase F [Armatimonadota bacterium]
MKKQLPLWDMTPIFPSLESHLFEVCFQDTLAFIGDLEALFDSENIRRHEGSTLDVALFERIISAWNETEHWVQLLGSYIACFVTTDAKNDLAKARQSELETRAVALGQLQTRLIAW